MTRAFIWFHNSSDNPSDSSRFYEAFLGWEASAGPGGMTMLAAESGPFAGIAENDGGPAGWIPYVEVDNVDAATKRAERLGASILKPKMRGPAGEFTIMRDPGGAAIALWQKA